jgi:predicted nucleotidyltransferase
MRLQKEEVILLKKTLASLSNKAQLYLFGSRVDDTKKGGDIDLLIISDELTKKDLRLLRVDFFKRFGEQKLDIILDNGEFTNPFTKIIFQKAILL